MNKLVKILLAIGVLLALIVGAVYLMGQFEATKPIADQATGLGVQATDYVQKNIPMVTAYAGTATAAVGGVLAYKKSAETKVAAVTTQANTQIDGVLKQKDELTDKLTNTQGQVSELQGKFTELETLKSAAEQKASTLATENEGLLRENNNLTQTLKDLKVATATVTEYK